MVSLNINNILKRALDEESLSKEEVQYLIGIDKEDDRKKLFDAAKEMRTRYFSDKVFMYGFVYFSTYCRNDCTFCYYRKSNSYCRRYRKSDEEIMQAAYDLEQSGAHLIDLTMGEDPEYLMDGSDKLIQLVKAVSDSVKLPVMVSPGVVNRDTLKKLRNSGATWYACYQETHNRLLYKALRINQNYDDRWISKVHAKEAGLLVEEGLLLGVGDGVKDAADSLFKMKSIDADQIRVMTFVPQHGTPMYKALKGSDKLELNMIAVMRIMFPDRLIPASLDVEGIVGLRERLEAGANVVTSLIPPKSGLMGVSQSILDIDEGNRTVKGIEPLLIDCGLAPAALSEYREFINKRHNNLEPVNCLNGGGLVCGLL
ncbi:methylornithine synthase PylB [Pseudobacteroides cellulosolvens]|uniref:Pyrrolysine biosynthesis protein PylB n=1 Tax=Pseudobacteroides cellulosolvens ATCC 35603 = DSM 2933 TaxID=398512 RepID=A0A0L6JQB2_9FIRM|nr:methylornithine synthase PylB [Pseudobacteroides cellulosolvens]KNY27979.1 Pyrrolysine biosynthesis protein PylB [Pseudobacteroides cellulosolvens ATCC 35603 = DSM 2933]